VTGLYGVPTRTTSQTGTDCHRHDLRRNSALPHRSRASGDRSTRAGNTSRSSTACSGTRSNAAGCCHIARSTGCARSPRRRRDAGCRCHALKNQPANALSIRLRRFVCIGQGRQQIAF
jgi:hypothetical protein